MSILDHFIQKHKYLNTDFLNKLKSINYDELYLCVLGQFENTRINEDKKSKNCKFI